MNRASNTNEKYQFLHSTYVMGNGIYILALDEDGSPYTDVTVNLTDIKLEENCILIPDHKKDDPIIKYFYDNFVDREIRTIIYGNFNNTATLVRLKPDWKERIKPIC